MRQGSCRLACSCVSVGQVEELGQVDGGAAGGGLDLRAAGEAVGEDQGVGVGHAAAAGVEHAVFDAQAVEELLVGVEAQERAVVARCCCGGEGLSGCYARRAMRNRGHRAALLILVLGFTCLAGVVAADGCDEPCPPGCGDCTACPLLAVLLASPDPSQWRCDGASFPATEQAPPPPPVRPPDHVPLGAA